MTEYPPSHTPAFCKKGVGAWWIAGDDMHIIVRAPSEPTVRMAFAVIVDEQLPDDSPQKLGTARIEEIRKAMVAGQ